MIVEDILWCMGSRSQKLGNRSESAAYGLARELFWIVEQAYRYNVWACLMGNVEVYHMESWRFGNRLRSCGSVKWAVVSIIIYRRLGQRPSIQKLARTNHPKGGNGWFVQADLHGIQHGRGISSWIDELDARGLQTEVENGFSSMIEKRPSGIPRAVFFEYTKTIVLPVLSGVPSIAPNMKRFP